MTDTVEALSLNFNPQYIDIYLASWGPDDDGATLEGPGTLARFALKSAIEKVSECKSLFLFDSSYSRADS